MAQCDVSTVVVTQGSIEVYIPVFWAEFEQVEIQDVGIEIRVVETFPPQFYVLQVDDVDERGNTTTCRGESHTGSAPA